MSNKTSWNEPTIWAFIAFVVFAVLAGVIYNISEYNPDGHAGKVQEIVSICFLVLSICSGIAMFLLYPKNK